jgi:phosphatidate cytidylyltransferase
VATVENLNARIRSWWGMCAVFGLCLAFGPRVNVALFAVMSFLALREFITLNQTRPADHAMLFWAFFIITPFHYVLVAWPWYGLFSIFIPVYGFILLPVRRVLAGETEGFLASTAKIQWGLLVCVYALSHLPMLLSLQLRDYAGQNAKLLFFLVCTAQLSDVLQYVFGKIWGRHPVAPRVSPKKTWEGLVGGIATTTLISTGLWWATPFQPWQAACMAFVICLAGFFGGLILSAIKRDLGAKDWGSSIAGHGGVLDRMDSLCFAAPLFYHLTRYYFSA